MLGLPKLTEMSKLLPKKAIYTKFHMNTAEKEKIDTDISKMTIVNEVSSEKIHIAEGKKVKSFFVMNIALKRKNFNESTIITISKLIPQNLILILEYENEAKLAIYHTKLIQTEWKVKETLTIQMKGVDMDSVWDNIIIQVGSIQLEEGNTLEEQIEINGKRLKIEKKIARLEKQARNEKQPRKKFELVQQIKKLRIEMEGLI